MFGTDAVTFLSEQLQSVRGRERGEEPSGTVRLPTFQSAARSVLEPVLPRFLLEHLSVSVVVDDHLADVVAAGFE